MSDEESPFEGRSRQTPRTPPRQLRHQAIATASAATSDSETEAAKRKAPLKKRKANTPPTISASPRSPVSRSPPATVEGDELSAHFASLITTLDTTLSADAESVYKAITNASKNGQLKGETKERLTAKVDSLVQAIHHAMVRISVEVGRKLGSVEATATLVDPIEIANTVAKRLEATQKQRPVPLVTPSYAPVSYANAVKVTSASGISSAIPPKRHSVVVYPKVVEGQPQPSSEAVRSQVFTALRPAEEGWRIAGVRNVARSGVMVSVSSSAEAARLLSSKELAAKGLRVEASRSDRPRLRLYDVPSSLDAAAIARCLHRQNLEELSDEEFRRDVKVAQVSPSKVKNGTSVVILECSSAVRKTLLLQDRVYLEFSACKVLDHLQVTRCYKCQAFGHPSKYCSQQQACSLCAGAHDFLACPKKDSVRKCVNCVRARMEVHDHPATSIVCPAYLRALEGAKRRTDYGSP